MKVSYTNISKKHKSQITTDDGIQFRMVNLGWIQNFIGKFEKKITEKFCSTVYLGFFMKIENDLINLTQERWQNLCRFRKYNIYIG